MSITASLAPLAAVSDALAALTADAARRVVAIRDGEGRTLSGFIWRTGLAVTAHEALESEEEADAILPDGTVARAQLAGRDPTTDVALLRLATAEYPDWVWADQPAAGSLSVLVGRTAESVLSSLAAVSEVGPAWRSMRGGEIDALVTLGLRLPSRLEGGAVVSPAGRLLGMAVSGARGRTLLIPASTLSRAVATLAEKGYVPRGWLGLSLHPVGQGGVIVIGIEPDSPAAQGGLLVGDIVTTWEGNTVRSVADVALRLGAGTVGTKARLGVLRGGSALELDLSIGERPRH